MIGLLLTLALSVPGHSLEVVNYSVSSLASVKTFPISTIRSPLSFPSAALIPLPGLPAFGAAALIPTPAAAPFTPHAAASSPRAPGAMASLSFLGTQLAAASAAGQAVEGPLEPFWTNAGRSRSDGDIISSLVAAAQGSKTAREILSRVRGPIPVILKDLPKRELGSFDYALGTLSVDRSHATSEPLLAAATLIHELVHVLQHAAGQTPAEALEMELEAHAVTIKVMDELSIPEGDRDEISRHLKVLLRDEGPEAFESYLAEQLPGKLRRMDGAEDLIDQLEADAAYFGDMAARGKRGADRMAALAERTQADADRLKTRAGRAAYARFANRVQSLLLSERRRLRKQSR